MKSEIDSRYSASWPFCFVITCGANDERMNNGVVETSIERFTENIREIIKIARDYTDKILFVGIPPFGKEVVEFKGQEYSDQRVKEYELHMKEIVESSKITFVPIRAVFEEEGLEKLFCYDNIHPNDRGHELISKTVEPTLLKLIGSK